MASDAGVYFWHAGDELFLLLIGRVTATEAYAFYRHLKEWLEGHPRGSLFIDLEQTTYIDSTTIGTLIRLHKQLRAGDGSLYLCNLSEPVEDVIRKTKLMNYFNVIENETLRSIDHDYLERLPEQPRGDLDSSFVLDAHNDICRVRPELAPKFEGLMNVLRDQVNRSS